MDNFVFVVGNKGEKRKLRDNVINFTWITNTYDMLGALQVANDGMRNWSAWTTTGQSHGSMFSQDTNGSSCQSNEAPNCSLRGTSPVSLLDSD